MGRRVDDRAPFLQRGRRPVLVLQTDAARRRPPRRPRRPSARRRDASHRRRRPTPAPRPRRRARASPIGLPSAAPPYAYSTLTFASDTSRSAGASDAGRVRDRRHDDVALGHLMMMLAQHGGRRARGCRRTRRSWPVASSAIAEDVDALVGQQPAHARERPGLFGSLRFTSVRIAMAQRVSEKAGRSGRAGR